MPKLIIEKVAFQAIIIDSGRQASQAAGFTQSGPMDIEAYQWGQWLCRHEVGEAAIEFIGSLHVTCGFSGAIAVTGPACTVKINDQAQTAWQTLKVNAGDCVKIEPQKLGTRHYLTVCGGLDVPLFQGSACTVSREGLGGLNCDGTALKPGDVIPCNNSTFINTELPLHEQPKYQSSIVVDVIPGYQDSWFSTVCQRRFYTSEYHLSGQIDRMGYRLEGPDVPASSYTLRSEAIALGAIQVPPDGQPIVMMRDRQTLGGYPKLGCIAQYDIWRFSQLVPGDSVCFQVVDMDTARANFLLKQVYQQRLVQKVQNT